MGLKPASAPAVGVLFSLHCPAVISLLLAVLGVKLKGVE
jgi:hypothetical protein